MKINLICEFCNKKFWDYLSNKRKFCSLDCYYKFRSIVFVGESHPRYKHLMTGTRFYVSYQGARARCLRPSYRLFYRYGGRGIKFLWKSFEEFRNDMYESYLKHVEKFGEKNTTIERIDNNGNYCKENCRWATPKEQARNRKTNFNITFEGKTKCAKDWAKKFSLNEDTVIQRIKMGWSVNKAFKIPTYLYHINNELFQVKRNLN